MVHRGKAYDDCYSIKMVGWISERIIFKKYPIKVINNGINLKIFKPTTGNFKERYKISEDKILFWVYLLNGDIEKDLIVL